MLKWRRRKEWIIENRDRRGGFTGLPGAFFTVCPSGALCCLFYVVTDRSAEPTPSGEPSCLFYVFTSRVLHNTTSGGSIFLLVKKDRGERHAKGLQSRPLETAFIRGIGGETCVLPTNSPKCNLRDLGSSDGVPVVFALHGFAGKPSTAFLRQFHCRKHCFRRTLAYCALTGVRQHRRTKYPWGAPSAVKLLALVE